MPYDYIEEYQKQNDETIWEFRDKDAQSKIDISSTETDYANPLTFETMQAQLAENTKIKLEPIQDLHGYDKPWVGGAGKNKFSPDLFPIIKGGNGINGSLNSETYTVSGTTTNAGGYYLDNPSKTLILKAGTYTFSFSTTGTWGTGSVKEIRLRKKSDLSIIVQLYDGSRNSRAFTLNEDTEIFFAVNSGPDVDAGVSVNVSMKVQLESGSTATSYEPYTNISPISGHDQIDILGVGKNILHINDGSYASGSVIVSNGLIKINGTFNSQTVNLANYVNRAELNKYIGKQLTFSKTDIKGNLEYNAPFFPGIGDWNYWHLNSNNKNTIIHNRKIDAFILYLNGTYDVEFYLQVEVNDDATEYEPYQESNDLTISFGQTVYGGQVDVEKGVLTIAYVADTTTWGDGTNETVLGNNTRKRLPNLSYIPKSNDGISNVAPYLQNWDSDITHFYIQVNQQCYCFLPNDTDNDTQIQVCYELATPITINLTPNTINLLKGINNISTDGTIITLTYRNGVFATLEELSDLDTNVKDIADKFNALGLSVVDGKLCQTYNT